MTIAWVSPCKPRKNAVRSAAIMPYTLFRSAVFTLPPERAHSLAIRALKLGLIPPKIIADDPRMHVNIMGLDFKNPLGMAAGFDKNAEAIYGLQQQGFSHIECGTVTLKPQVGNPKPRVFRLTEDEAVINRLGFNNDGIGPFLARLKRRARHHAIVGANIGRNKETDDAIQDYVELFKAVVGVADYVTVNVSSPNTQGVRGLQEKNALGHLLGALRTERAARNLRTPIVLKIAPDLDTQGREDVAAVALENKVDALIVSNTTIKRPNTLKSPLHGESGGLSGQPLFAISTQELKDMYRFTDGKIPLIGVGGVASAEQAYAKILSGASLVQLYTGLIYHGFGLVPQILSGLKELMEKDGFTQIQDAVGKGASGNL